MTCAAPSHAMLALMRPAETPGSVPVLAGNRLERILELKNRISQASVPRRGRSWGFRDHQHFNWLAGFKWQALHDQFAMLADRSLSPV